jgi:hypothetical protein
MEEEKGFWLKMSNFPIAKVVYLYWEMARLICWTGQNVSQNG